MNIYQFKEIQIPHQPTFYLHNPTSRTTFISAF